MKICRYIMEMHRSSDIEGVFLMTDEELNLVKEMEGYEVYYGEVAGKHSEVRCNLYYKDIEILSDKPEEIEFFNRIFPHGVGFHFKSRWFCDDYARDDGYEAGSMKCYKSAEEALETDYQQHNNAVMRKHFIECFNKEREDQ